MRMPVETTTVGMKVAEYADFKAVLLRLFSSVFAASENKSLSQSSLGMVNVMC